MAGLPVRQAVESLMNAQRNWLGVPRVIERYRYLFRGLSFFDKMQLVRHGLDVWRYRYQADPADTAWLASNIFDVNGANRPRKFARPPTSQGAFCGECFRSQMEKSGFTWFRLPWTRSPVCDVHESPLGWLRCGSCGHSEKNPTRNLVSCLSGKCVSSGENIWDNAPNVESRAYPASNGKQLEGYEPYLVPELPNLSPCVSRAICFKIFFVIEDEISRGLTAENSAHSCVKDVFFGPGWQMNYHHTVGCALYGVLSHMYPLSLQRLMRRYTKRVPMHVLGPYDEVFDVGLLVLDDCDCTSCDLLSLCGAFAEELNTLKVGNGRCSNAHT